MSDRRGEIVKNIIDGHVIREQTYGDRTILEYGLVLQNVISHQDRIHIEEQRQIRRAIFEDGDIIDDYQLQGDGEGSFRESHLRQSFREDSYGSIKRNITYDRLAVVQYAERWWNEYNPNFKRFDSDCTNYVSQCIHAGGVPMKGFPDQANGWWYKNSQWSYSWTVAHAFRWYVSGTKSGINVQEVSSPDQLLRGDVICYDFNGDGNWQHTTIVVAKDGDGMPLVNAHTTDSRMRYWSYEDSTAWTSNIKYKFFHILDEQ
ncbi:MAG: amidase domain-containing protein [Bacillus sp. (in: Bacteria)]|nr:amidase domain-containing protein [Bacillus sp. (in: firmicutes)]